MTIPKIDKVKVNLQIENINYHIGAIAEENKQFYFKYDDKFVKTNLSLSPIKLPFNTQIQTPETKVFDGLFGVFWDSLPDGWGRFLQDKYIQSKNRSLSNISSLSRLCFVGDRGPGALTYEPFFDTDPNDMGLNMTLWDVFRDVKDIYENNQEENLWNIYSLGGTSGGARPKINCGYDTERDTLYFGDTDHTDVTRWIIKFPASTDLKDIAHIEYAYIVMAKKCGLHISESKIFKAK